MTSIHSGDVVSSGLFSLVQNHILLDFKENFLIASDAQRKYHLSLEEILQSWKYHLFG